MNVRQLLFTPIALAFVVLSGCGSSSTEGGAKTPDDVASNGSGETNESATNDKPTDDRPANDTKEMPHGAKASSDSIPEDYTLTNRDCVELAKQYGVVQKADQMATLSPKLSATQKAQGEKAIDDAVAQLRERWENSCVSSLVGGVVDRESLKCAMASKTVKGFDECINGKEPGK